SVRMVCVGLLAAPAHLLADRIPQSLCCAERMGVGVPDVSATHSPDHRRAIVAEMKTRDESYNSAVARAVGRSMLRKDGFDKVTGAAKYIDDLSFPNLLHARTIRSDIPAGEIAGIAFDFEKTGFTIVDHRDVPGRNIVALIDDDQPCLVERTVRHVAEPILILAHADRERLRAAGVRIDYRPTTPNYDPAGSVVSFKSIAIDKGDLSAGFSAADTVVEGEYRVGSQEQLYIEPNGVIAVPAEDGHGITVYGSMQCPYYVHRALMVL